MLFTELHKKLFLLICMEFDYTESAILNYNMKQVS